MIEEHKIDVSSVSPDFLAGVSFLRHSPEDRITLNKNRFSDPEIYWSSVKDKNLKQTIEETAARLNYGPITKIEVSGEPSVYSENYRVKFKNKKDILLKRCSSHESEEFLNALHHTIDYAIRNGVRAPALIPLGENGKVPVEMNGSRWLAYEFVPALSHFKGDGMQVYEAAFQIGTLNHVLTHYAADFPDTVETHYSNPGWEGTGLVDPKVHFRMWEGICRALDRALDTDPNVELIRQRSSEIQNALKSYAALYPELLEYKSANQVIHNDLHPHNLLIKGKKDAWLLDLHLMTVRSIYSEIGWAFHQTVKQSALELADVEGSVSYQELKDLGHLFYRGYSAGNPDAEWQPKVIYGYALNEFLSSALHHISKIIINGDKRWEFDLPRHLDDIADVQKLMPIALNLG